MTRSIFPILVVLSIASVLIFLARQRIWTESGLEGACKQNTRAYFVAKMGTPTDWTPSMLSKLGEGMRSVMNFYGSWRVGTKHYDVMCSARYGDPIVSVGYEIGEPK
jgi:hypothetical protein